MNQQELLNTQTNAEETDNSKSNSSVLISRDPIPGTPFWIVGDEEKGYFLLMGKWKITDNRKTKEEILQLLQSEMWTIILRIVGVVTEQTITDKGVDEIIKTKINRKP